jgi:argininosuccinate lyase
MLARVRGLDPDIADPSCAIARRGRRGFYHCDGFFRLGIPFRDAHAVVGAAVRLAIERGCDLEDLNLTDFQRLHPGITDAVYAVLDVDRAVAARDHVGGTAPRQVREACQRARFRVQACNGGKR